MNYFADPLSNFVLFLLLIFFIWSLKVNNDYKKLPKTTEMLQEEEKQKFDIFKGFLFGFLFLILFVAGPYACPPPYDDILDKKIAKYYTPEEIARDNIHVVRQRNEIKLSNGVVLPDEDFRSFDNELTLRYYLPLFIILFVLYNCIV